MSRTILVSVAAMVLLAATTIVSAQIPRTISFQGVLADPTGQVIPDGNHTLTLRLYPTLQAGTPLYSEQQEVPVVRGVFNAIIGSKTPIPADVAFDRAYFLGVTVDGGAEMAPRTPLTAAPYAMRAVYADSIAAGAAVRSLNGRTGTVVMQGGGGTTITQSGNTLTVYSSGGGGSAGVQGIQSTDGTIDVTGPNGPVATLGVADGAITAGKIAPGAVTGSKIAAGAIDSTKLADNAVTSSKLASGAVTMRAIAAGAVGRQQLADSSVSQRSIGPGVSVPPTGAAGGSLSGTYPNPSIAAGAVNTDELKDGAVTSQKILDGTITGGDISSNAALGVASISTSGNSAIGAGAAGIARLLVQGSGATVGTTSLDVIDNAGGNLLRVRDDGSIGVGVANPAARLDIAAAPGIGFMLRGGSFVVPVTAVVASPGVVIPPNAVAVRITNDGVPIPIGLIFPAAFAGQILIITDDDPDAVAGPFPIASGQTRMFIAVGGAWRLVN